MGVVGLKIDFFDSEAQHITRYYEETLRDAAEFGLMINFHGSNKPTGLSRTYPNEVSREGVMGLEFGCSWADENTVTPASPASSRGMATTLRCLCRRTGVAAPPRRIR